MNHNECHCQSKKTFGVGKLGFAGSFTDLFLANIINKVQTKQKESFTDKRLYF